MRIRANPLRLGQARTGAPSPPTARRLNRLPIARASSSKPPWPFLMSKYCAVENQSSVIPSPGERFQRMTRRSALRYGSGCNNSGAGDTVDRGVRADADRDRKNRRDCKARRAQQTT